MSVTAGESRGAGKSAKKDPRHEGCRATDVVQLPPPVTARLGHVCCLAGEDLERLGGRPAPLTVAVEKYSNYTELRRGEESPHGNRLPALSPQYGQAKWARR